MNIVILSKGQKRKIKELYLSEFHSVVDIANMLSLSTDKVRQYAKSKGLKKVQYVKWLTKEAKRRIQEWNGEKSISSLSKEFGCNAETLRKYMKKHGIETNKQTNTKNEKIEVTEEMKEIILSPKLARWEVSQMLGVSVKWVSDKRKELGSEGYVLRKDYKKQFSLPEKKFADMLIVLDRVFFHHYNLLGYNVDFYLGNKTIVEIQGSYFHNQEEVREADEKKRTFFESKGYRVIYFTDHELDNIELIKLRLG